MSVSIDYFNKAQPKADVELQPEHWAAMTYGCGLRLGDNDGGEFFSGRRTALNEDCLISARQGGKVQIQLYHGRENPEEQLDDWGFNAEENPTADAVHLRPEGVYLLDFSGKKARARLIPFYEDMLVWRGHYYGDISFCTP